MKRFRLIFIAIMITSLSGGYILRSIQKGIDESAYLQEVATGVIFGEKRGDPPYYPSDSELIAFNSYDIRPDIRGYAGPIKVLIVLDKRGTITGLKLLEHRETKNYIHYMETPEYLSQFIGKSVNEPFEIDRDIDGISRATVSVEALARTIRESSRLMAARVFNIEVKDEERKSPGFDKSIIYMALFITGFSFFYMSRKKRFFLKTRDIILILAFVILGLYLASPFSVLHIYNLLLLRFSSSILFYILIFSLLLSLVLAGRFYCGWLCPFGAIAEFIGRIPVKKWNIPEETDLRSRRLKYYILFFVTAIVFLSGVPEYATFETYITLFSFRGNLFQWSLLGIMILINLRIRRAWCRYFCPAGAFTGLFSRRLEGYKSTNDCPLGNPSGPPDSECIRCNRCSGRLQ